MLTNKLNFAFGGFVALTLLALFASSLFTHQEALAGSFNATVIGAATTTTAVSVTASTRVLATTTSLTGTSYTRVYATICNPSSTIVSLGLNQDKALSATSATAFIGAAGGYEVCYEITDRNMYQGSIQASSTVGAVNVFVAEYVQ